MKDEIKEKPVVAMLPVIQASELIKVKTISAKIVDQMPWIQMGSSGWLGQEVIGRFPGGGVLILRHSQSGFLSRMSDEVYLIERTKQLGSSAPDATWIEVRDQAQAELHSFPQVFGV